jgi:hypothetical protein
MSAAEKSGNTFTFCGEQYEYAAAIVGMDWTKTMSDAERGKWLQEKLDIGSVWRRGHKGEDRKPEPPPPQKPAANDKVINFEAEKRQRTESADDDGEMKRNLMRRQALEYEKCGLHVVKLNHHAKTPSAKDWNTTRLTAEQIESFYSSHPMPNVGVVLGATSKGVCDIDLDWPIAARMAQYVFNSLTGFGRIGKPHSHRLFRVANMSEDVKSIAFTLPDVECLKGKLPKDHPLCVMELRANGAYTVFPPSIHPSGEQITWDNPPYESPREHTWDEMVDLSGLTAFLSAMVQFYPIEGLRNQFSLALGGALIRFMMKAYKDDEPGLVAAVDHLVQAVCTEAGDKGHGRSWTDRAGNTLARIKDGKPTTGLKALCDILGFDKVVELRFRQWLGAEVDDRPQIVYEELNLDKVLEQTQDALVDSGVPIYSKATRLLYVGRLDKGKRYTNERGEEIIEVDGVKRAAGSLTLLGFNPSYLYQKIVGVANWRSIVMNKGEPMQVRRAPPRSIAADIIARPVDWRFPILNGMVQTPTMRLDGSIVSVEGYDEQTGLLFDFGGVKFGTVPEHPTFEDAKAALQRIKWLLAGFAFVPDEGSKQSSSLSAALALLLTTVVRRILQTSPLFLLSAAKPGEGKTLLAELNGIIATGKIPPHISYGGDDVENEKRMTSVLYRGDSLVNLDNVTVQIGGDFINSMLTQELVNARLLGGNEFVDLPTNLAMTATGVNLAIRSDMNRRALRAYMDSGVPRPEERTNFADVINGVDKLKDYARANRAQYVIDLLTVLRAFKVSGATIDVKTAWGSFEQWSNIIRKPLIWLGEPDPCDTRAEVREDDPVAETNKALVMAWRDYPALEGWKTPGQIIEAINQHGGEALGTALADLCSHGLSTRSLGSALTPMLNSTIELPAREGNGVEWFKIRKKRNAQAAYLLELVPQQASLLTE